jgi:hypothetical protein
MYELYDLGLFLKFSEPQSLHHKVRLLSLPTRLEEQTG